MIRHVHIGVPGVYAIDPVDADARENRPRYETAPPPSAPELQTTVYIEGPCEQGQATHYYRVGVPEQIGEWRPDVDK